MNNKKICSLNLNIEKHKTIPNKKSPQLFEKQKIYAHPAIEGSHTHPVVVSKMPISVDFQRCQHRECFMTNVTTVLSKLVNGLQI